MDAIELQPVLFHAPAPPSPPPFWLQIPKRTVILCVFGLAVLSLTIGLLIANFPDVNGVHMKCPDGNSIVNFYNVSTLRMNPSCCHWQPFSCTEDSACHHHKEYIFKDATQKCTTSLDFLSCAPFSPYLRTFFNISAFTGWNELSSIDVCEGFCEEVYHVCHRAVVHCVDETNSKCNKKIGDVWNSSVDFCTDPYGLGVSVVERESYCFNSSCRIKVSQLLIVVLLLSLLCW